MNTFIANIWIKNNIKVLSNESNISVYDFSILAWKEVENIAKRNININSSLGLYLLFNEENDLYIGETETFFSRIAKHYNDKDKAWVEEVIFININSANKTELHILENKFIELFKNDAIFQLENGNDGQGYNNKQSVYEQERIDLFYKTTLKFLDILGIIPTTISEQNYFDLQNKDDLIFEFKSNNGHGKMVVKNNNYILKSGSKINPTLKDYLGDKTSEIHKKLLVLYPSLILENDFVYTSPSLLGSLISGSSVSGRKVWKEIKTHKPLEDFIEE